MKPNLTCLILPLLFLASCQPKKGIREEEIRSAIARFDSAWQRKNAPGVDSVLSGSYLYFTQSGGTFSRAEVIGTAGSPEYRLQSFSRRIVSWKTEGQTALVNTLWIGQGIYRGVPFSDTQRCSMTLVKTGNELKILSEHCTLIRPSAQ